MASKTDTPQQIVPPKEFLVLPANDVLCKAAIYRATTDLSRKEVKQKDVSKSENRLKRMFSRRTTTKEEHNADKVTVNKETEDSMDADAALCNEDNDEGESSDRMVEPEILLKKQQHYNNDRRRDAVCEKSEEERILVNSSVKYYRQMEYINTFLVPLQNT